ncbi:hypothetical protein ACFWI5_36315 [Streptomyces sp. NPDC127064]|uniref:hypothetical protein n=1 Tax=Streptomyces sp. NPDC127064 TaxID=3347124 RepID=UPI00365C197B
MQFGTEVPGEGTTWGSLDDVVLIAVPVADGLLLPENPRSARSVRRELVRPVPPALPR